MLCKNEHGPPYFFKCIFETFKTLLPIGPSFRKFLKNSFYFDGLTEVIFLVESNFSNYDTSPFFVGCRGGGGGAASKQSSLLRESGTSTSLEQGLVVGGGGEGDR